MCSIIDLKAAPGTQEIDLTWTPDGNSHTLERSAGPGGPWNNPVLLTSGTSSYNDTGIPTGTSYYYRLQEANLSCSNVAHGRAG